MVITNTFYIKYKEWEAKVSATGAAKVGTGLKNAREVWVNARAPHTPHTGTRIATSLMAIVAVRRFTSRVRVRLPTPATDTTG